MNRVSLTMLASAMLVTSANADVLLGTFDFNSTEFGNTMTESDGGPFRNANWLNLADADPGNPGALTGANFDTGIANIGIISSVAIDYTIGYSTPIVNGTGDDMGLVTGYSFSGDTYHVAVSTDGVNFTSFVDFAGSSGTDTGVNNAYFYGGAGPYSTDLIVLPLDLSVFGIAPSSSIVAVRLEGRPGEQPDLFRIAGLGSPTSTVPEPSSVILFASSAAALLLLRRQKRRGPRQEPNA